MDLSQAPQEFTISFPQSQVLIHLEVYVKRNTKKSSMIESEELETLASTPPSQAPLSSTQRRRDLP